MKVVSSLLSLVFVFVVATGCASTSETRRDIFQVQVEAGDTLNSIAKQFDTNWHDIIVLNKTTLRHGLRVGQVLSVVPGPEAVTSMKQASSNNVAMHEEMFEEDDADDMRFAPRRKGLLFGGTADTKAMDFVFPVEGRVTSHFGKRGRKLHKGIDIGAMVGMPIVSAADGEVIFSGKRRGYGGTVVVDHGGFISLYAHCSKMIAKVGDTVKQGDYIARSGRTGNARGAHLHFEIRDADNNPLDPLPLLRQRTVSQRGTAPVVAAGSRELSQSQAPAKKRGLLYAVD